MTFAEWKNKTNNAFVASNSSTFQSISLAQIIIKTLSSALTNEIFEGLKYNN